MGTGATLQNQTGLRKFPPSQPRKEVQNELKTAGTLEFIEVNMS